MDQRGLIKKNMTISLCKHLFDRVTNQLVLHETLVDKFFEELPKKFENQDVFDEKFFLELSYYFETRMGVHLEYEQDNVKVLDGRFDRPDTIVLVFPKNLVYRNKITDKDFMNVLFHELTHFLIDEQFRPRLTEIKQSGKRRNIIDAFQLPPLADVHFESSDQTKIVKFLRYYLQPRERSNWAFSIAFSMYLKYKINETTKSLVDKNSEIIRDYNLNPSDKKYEFDSHYYVLKEIGLRVLFEIQYFITKVKSSSERKTFYNDFLRLVKLIDKYRSRFYTYCKRYDENVQFSNLMKRGMK